MIDDAAIASILINTSPLTQMADELVALANRNGGRDNITVLLMQALSGREKSGLMSRWLGKH
jgi:protein phosphatase